MPPTEQSSPGIVPVDAAATEEVFGSLPTQLRTNDNTPVSLTPAVTSFLSFLQTSKQSILPSFIWAHSLEKGSFNSSDKGQDYPGTHATQNQLHANEHDPADPRWACRWI
jgi:hypothetical protein